MVVKLSNQLIFLKNMKFTIYIAYSKITISPKPTQSTHQSPLSQLYFLGLSVFADHLEVRKVG